MEPPMQQQPNDHLSGRWKVERVTGPRSLLRKRRPVPMEILFKGAGIILIAPLLVLSLFVFNGFVSVTTAFYGLLFIFALSIIFVRPYITNLAALTEYVHSLAKGERVEAPDLSFLNNVQELTAAVDELNRTWQSRGQQLQALLEESEILIDSLPDIVVMLDQACDVVRINHTGRRIFGSDAKTYIQQVVAGAEIQQLAEQVLEDGHGRELPYFLSEPYHRHYIMRIERLHRDSPREIALLLVMHDITQMKQTEAMLADFVANASHEIRTPLTSILGFIYSLENDAKDDVEMRTRFLEVMKAQANRMAQLVKDLLSLSQVERNLYTRPSQRVQLLPILEEVQQHTVPLAKERDMAIDVHVPNQLKEIYGDVGELTQVFENLVTNAIKYGRVGTPITVSAREVPNRFPEVEALRPYENLLAVSVQDRGEGIAREHIPRLTERFYRVDKARSRKIGGSGLGLSIVRHILDRHQGMLTIDSTVGEGSTFTVYLPIPR